MKTNFKTTLAVLLLFLTQSFCITAQEVKQAAPAVKGVGVVLMKNNGNLTRKVSSVTNDKGETEIDIPEKGNYVLRIIQPQAGNSQDGSPAAITQTQGGPVKGIKVALGKNPSGKITSFNSTNDKGEVEFTNLEPGNYSIRVVANDINCPPGCVMKNGVCEPITIMNPQSKTIRTSCEGGTMDCREKVIKDGVTWWVYADKSDCPQRGQSCTGTWSVDKEKLINLNPDNTSNSSGSTTGYVGHVTLMRFSEIFIGGGLVKPSTKTKQAGLVNGIDINLGYYHPIWIWNKSNISLGLSTELGYSMGNGSYAVDQQYKVYQLLGQVQPPKITESAESTKNTTFRAGAGLQMNIHLGKFTVSPIFNTGYLSTTQKSYSVDETIYPQGSSLNYRLFEQKETKTSGLGFLPKLRFAYYLTPRIGIWLEGNYLIGPKIKSETTRFVIDPTIPENNINEGNFQEGQYIKSKTESSYSAIGLNIGVVLRLGMKIKGTTTTSTSTNLISSPCYEITKTLYCYDGNNNCKLICDNVNNSLCGMATFKKEIPCNTSTPTGTVNSMIKSYYFKEKPVSSDELSYEKIREIILGILPDFSIEDVTLNSYKDNYLLLVEGSQNNTSANVNIMLSNENGKLYLTDDIRILQCKDPSVIKKGNGNKFSKKHDYVGHVTLLR